MVEQHIKIRSAASLTNEMLAFTLPNGQTLSEFLSKTCSVISEGAYRIFQTTEARPFKCLDENRLINEAHVQVLMQSYAKDGYLFTIVYVNEKLEIIDGQHRFESARRKGLPIYFMVMPAWGIGEVTILNMNSRNWTILDFMETHAKAGNPNYIRFKEFYDANEFDVTVCQLIITGRRSGRLAATDVFRSGQMQVDDMQITDAWLKAKRIAELKLFHPHGWKNRNFVEAMLMLFGAKGYDHAHMVAKLRTYPELLLAEARSLRYEEYVRLFIDKYNFRRSKDKIKVVRE